MRVAVVDVGTNTTRLLVAEVTDTVTELDRRSVITRLGAGVDRSGRLRDDAQQRVLDVIAEYARAFAGCEHRVAVLTSAVRDAENGAQFAERVRAHGLDARTLSGDEEAQLTFRGATALRDDGEELLVADIGGGSTELIVGARGRVRRHASTQIGVVRHGERHLHDDPPTPEQLDALTQDVRAIVKGSDPSTIGRAVAVAGTPTQLAAIDLELEPYDPARVEGHVLGVPRLEELRDRLAVLGLEERRRIPGLDPERAPVIVPGVVILLEVLAAYGLDEVEVSERDILWGVALSTVAGD